MNEIIKGEKQDLHVLGENCELSDDLHVMRVSKNTEGFDFKGALAKLPQYLNIADIITHLEKGVQYVVQVPLEHQAELQNGVLQMMKGTKSGKTWATLVRVLQNGKKEIVCNCPIVEQAMVTGNPLASIAGSFQNLYLQRKLADISEQIREVSETCKRIEKGQESDRVGKLLAGRNAVITAMSASENSRHNLLIGASQELHEAQAQIGYWLKDSVERFEKVSRMKTGRLFRDVLSLKTDYQEKKHAEFMKMQDIYYLYLLATKYLAVVFFLLKEKKSAQTVFTQAEEFLKMIDFSKVKTLDYIYPDGDMEDAFYHKPVGYVEEEKVACLQEAEPYQYIELAISCEELLEASENV